MHNNYYKIMGNVTFKGTFQSHIASIFSSSPWSIYILNHVYASNFSKPVWYSYISGNKLYQINRLNLLFQVIVEASGFYDNIGHGMLVEGEAIIQQNDILCNQMSGVLAEGEAKIQVSSTYTSTF